MSDNRRQASEAIQHALLNGQSLSSVTAGLEFGYWRLAALVHRLRCSGWPIESYRENNNGLAIYRLPEGWTPPKAKNPPPRRSRHASHTS